MAAESTRQHVSLSGAAEGRPDARSAAARALAYLTRHGLTWALFLPCALCPAACTGRPAHVPAPRPAAGPAGPASAPAGHRLVTVAVLPTANRDLISDLTVQLGGGLMDVNGHSLTEQELADMIRATLADPHTAAGDLSIGLD